MAASTPWQLVCEMATELSRSFGLSTKKGVTSCARLVYRKLQFYEYRASIEEEYARRMTKLAKQPLGRDEIGYVADQFQVLSCVLF